MHRSAGQSHHCRHPARSHRTPHTRSITFQQVIKMQYGKKRFSASLIFLPDRRPLFSTPASKLLSECSVILTCAGSRLRCWSAWCPGAASTAQRPPPAPARTRSARSCRSRSPPPALSTQFTTWVSRTCYALTACSPLCVQWKGYPHLTAPPHISVASPSPPRTGQKNENRSAANY